MWNSLLPAEIIKFGIPGLYETERVPLEEKMIYLHFFLGSADWYMAEYSPVDDLFFGYANLGDPQMAEWGYISHQELRDIKIGPGIEVDRDRHWTPKKACDIEAIVMQHNR